MVRLDRLVVVILVLLGMGLAPPASGASTGDSPGSPVVAQATETADRNESAIRHENPNDADGERDLGALRRWFEGRMGNVHANCTDGLLADVTDGCDALDDQYPDWLSNYVDLAEETEDDDDNEAGDPLHQAREELKTYQSQMEEFQETREELEETEDLARERSLVRRLNRQASDLNGTGANLIGIYGRLNELTSADFSPAIENVRVQTENVTEIAEVLSADLFEETRLTVRVQSETVSFRSPLRVEGILTAENGSGLADRRIELIVGNQTMQTRTNGTGGFEFRHRPTTVSLDVTSITVRFRPANESRFQGARSTLPVEIEQVEPSITVDREPATVGFGDTLTVSGTMAVGDVGVPRVPVVVSVGDTRLGRTATADDGTYEVDISIPASIPDGEVAVEAAVPLENRALAGVNTSTPVTIEETGTNLTLNASGAGDGRIRAAGALTTEDGVVLGNRVISLSANGTAVQTVRTGDNGSFEATFDAQVAESGSTTVQIVARFDGSGTSLQSAQARANATVVVGTSPETATESEPDAGGFMDRLFESIDDDIVGGSEDVVGTTVDRLGDFISDPLDSVTDPDWWGPWLLVPALLVLLAAILFSIWWTGTVPFVAVLGDRLPRVSLKPLIDRLAGVSLAGLSWLGGSTNDEGDIEDSDTGVDSAEVEPDPADPPSIFERLQQVEYPEETISNAYGVVRGSLSDRLGVAGKYTHWEFLAACRETADSLEDVEEHALQQLTEAYEEAAFAPGPVSTETAERALEATRTLLEGRSEEFEWGPAD